MPYHQPRTAIAVVGTAILLISGCTNKDEGVEPRGIATADPGEIVSVMGNGSNLVPPRDGDIAAKSGVAQPSALVEAADGGLLVAQADDENIVEVSPAGKVKMITKGDNGLYSGADSIVRLPDGTVAVLDTRSNGSGKLGIYVGRLGSDGRITWLPPVLVPDTGNARTEFASSTAGPLHVLWNNQAWTEQAGRLVPFRIDVPGDKRAIAGDGRDLLVATDERVFRLRDGIVVTSLPIPPADSGRVAEVQGITPDGSGGVFVSRFDPAAVHHLRSDGSAEAVATAARTVNCEEPVRGSAREAPLRAPSGLLVRSGQLLIADSSCNRIFSVGLR